MAANNDNDLRRRVQLVSLAQGTRMIYRLPYEDNVQHNANITAMLEILLSLESDDDSDATDDMDMDSDDDITPAPMAYVLVDAEVNTEWECVICQEEEVKSVVWHPGNCHAFHEQCLQRSMAYDVRCPLCRACVTPLLMHVVVSDEGEMSE